MQPAEVPTHAASTLDAVRRRGQGYLGVLLWVLMILGLLWTANIVFALLERFVAMLHGVRSAAGFAAPGAGPDFWILGGVGFVVLLAGAALLWAYRAYRQAWNRRLAATWGHTRMRPEFVGMPRLEGVASARAIGRQSEYLNALLSAPGWSERRSAIPPADGAETYKAASAQVLAQIETDIANRAVTAGLVIGLNRNPLIDTLTIVATALELQLHVLTRLGKRPSPAMWMELLRRAGASVFLNTYVTRDDALYLNLAIRKAALGLEVAADAAQNAMDDLDLDEIMGQTSVPGLAELTRLASFGVSVGASGIRHIGNFIEHTANDLLQGVIAGGVLYYHGMALAADCLALDEQHRRSPEMTRTLAQAMTVAVAPAGHMLRGAVRQMRTFLRERRRQIFSAAKGNVSGAAGKMRETLSGWSEKAAGLFRNDVP